MVDLPTDIHCKSAGIISINEARGDDAINEISLVKHSLLAKAHSYIFFKTACDVMIIL